MKIIRAELRHLSQLSILFNKYRVFYRQTSNPGAAEKFISDRLKNKDSIIFAAESEKHDNKLVGFVQLYPSFTSVQMKRLYVVNDLFVDEHCRREGVAKALMTQASAFAKADGAAKLSLHTQVGNQKARALYSQLGYEEEHEFVAYNLNLSFSSKPSFVNPSEDEKSDDEPDKEQNLSKKKFRPNSV